MALGKLLSFVNQYQTRSALIALFLGAALGLSIQSIGFSESHWIKAYFLNGFIYAVAKIFLTLIKLTVIPVVFLSLLSATKSLDLSKKTGRLGTKIFGYFFVTTVISVIWGIFLSVTVQPGSGVLIGATKQYGELKSLPSFADTIINFFPKSIIDPFVNGNTLQLIVLSIIIGLTISQLGSRAGKLSEVIDDGLAITFKFVDNVLMTLPFGVFALCALSFSKIDLNGILAIGQYYGLVIIALLIHLGVFYPAILKFISGISPFQFYRKFKDTVLFALSTASSNATIPVNTRTVQNMGVDKSITSFMIPLGATVNMDGTVLRLGIVIPFLAQIHGIDLSAVDYFSIASIAIFASIGTVGIPGGGLIALLSILTHLGIPVELVGTLMAVDRLIDMTITVTNVTSDGVGAVVVSKSEKMLDSNQLAN